MSQEPTPRSRLLLEAAPAHLPYLAWQAFLWALPWTCILVGLYAVLAIIHHQLSPGAPSLSLERLLKQTVGLAIFQLVVLFLARWLWVSPLMDSAFKVVGFLATFFGLVMLALFLFSIGHDVLAWFQTTRRLVELENSQLLRHSEEMKNVLLYKEKELARIRGEMEAELEAAADEAEKEAIRKDYQDKIIPRKLGDLEKRLVELKLTTEKDFRADTSGFALLGHFLTHGASRQPQDCGIYYALLGSLYVAVIAVLFAVPVGIATALYLEEYRSKGWVGNLIQININNLAGVPSVVYGILGGYVFVELLFKGLVNSSLDPTIAPRNVLGGGLTLGLLTLPVVIVASQEAIRAVPRSIRDGAYALGATQWQTIWHNVLPMATPGILTGTILSLSRAIGEAAPMVLFGALLFVDAEPDLFSRFTVVPMQIFNWVDQPVWSFQIPEAGGMRAETAPAFHYNAAMGIVVLLVVLLGMNAIAIVLRNRAQRQMRF